MRVLFKLQTQNDRGYSSNTLLLQEFEELESDLCHLSSRGPHAKTAINHLLDGDDFFAICAGTLKCFL
jgi:hypothetical protein